MQQKDIHDSSHELIRSRDVLIVDDDVDLCRILTCFLTQNGRKVCAVHTGERALKIVRTNLVAVIWLDIGLPDFSGLDLLREIPRFAATPS